MKIMGFLCIAGIVLSSTAVGEYVPVRITTDPQAQTYPVIDGKAGVSDFAALATYWMQSCPDGWPLK